ncbi:glycosyltransferase family 1 protein [Microbacterium enclense]|uniref:Glycosyltransferase family 1 protein n=2 Tax=Microbacterium enclense TaxID=993073 RepID=A0A443JP37_9MICO|nr:glycosyltransferase [Microbacterium enclense]RWR22268.1 glycosyltransferase family 1 protein [Microbacterium enclense]
MSMLQVARSLWRSARDRPVFRPLVARLDRLWWFRAIARADIVDLDYVRAQTGRALSANAAIRRYVSGGYRDGFRLNPLFVDTAVGDHLPEAWRVPALYAYVVADPRGLQVSPLWDATAYGERHPEAWSVPGGPVAHAWHRREEESLPFGPDALPSPAPWSRLSKVIADAAHRARVGGEIAAPPGTVPLEREMLVALGPDEWDFDESIAEAIAFAAVAGQGSAIAVLDPRAEDWTLAQIAAASTARVRVSRRRHDDAASALDELRRTSIAEIIVLRGPNQTLTAGDAGTLADRVHEHGAGTFLAPVWLDGDGTIAAIGATGEGRFLAGHPVEDLTPLLDADGPSLEVPALAGSTFAAHRADIDAELRGADAAAAASVGGTAHVALDLYSRTRSPIPPAELPHLAANADALLERAGWERARTGPSPRVQRPVRATVLADGTTVPVLRWALRTAAPVGPRAEGWGDTHFARALAAALRRQGQEVVIDAYPARHRPTRHLDDVTVALRGPEPLEASPFGTSLLWIISHPDQIGTDDVAGFDAVFSASAPWARRAAAELGVPITPLLQCTDATRFRPSGAPRGRDILFVGTARGILRPSVVEPIRAGIPVTVIGPDWRGWIPADRIAATGVDNDALPDLYERAGVVLNDHWPAMRERGFIGNRLFDVVAAGGRAISDRVEGIDALFEGAVRTYGSIPELIDMLSGDLDEIFPTRDVLARIAERVRAEHSFDARARALLDAALHARDDGGDDGKSPTGLAS